jgi:phage tail tape-measure protein
MQKSNKHLDNEKKATVASGERKSGQLMDGIVGGLPRKVSPAVVDGVVRGIARGNGAKVDVSKVMASATPMGRGTFGSGAFPEGHM